MGSNGSEDFKTLHLPQTSPKVIKLVSNFLPTVLTKLRWDVWNFEWIIHAFLLMLNSNMWRNFPPLRDIMLQNLSDLDFDLQGHLRSNEMVLLDSSYLIFYCCVIVRVLTRYTRYPCESSWPWHWPLKVTKIKYNHTNGHPVHAFLLLLNSNMLWRSLRSNVIVSLDSQYMVSF